MKKESSGNLKELPGHLRTSYEHSGYISVSNEMTYWLKSMQNPQKLLVNDFILYKIAKFQSEVLQRYVSQILFTFPEHLFSIHF